MQKLDNGSIRYSPTDLTRYLKSPFAAAMERLALEDASYKALRDEPDALMASLQQKGYAHEDALEAEFKAAGKNLVHIDSKYADAYQRTVAAMQSGADIIVQARLELNEFAGYADFLVRTDGSSAWGDWHYEVWDTKLARKTSPSFLLQLCCYADMLQAAQQRLPASVTVALGNGEQQRFTLADYYAFYQTVKADFLRAQADFRRDAMPDPAHFSDHGDWSDFAAAQLEARDHVCRVATVTQAQGAKLMAAGIDTLTQLATSEQTEVPGIEPSRFERLRRQAALQLASIDAESVPYELLPHDGAEPEGLQLLPPASTADVFFDIEGFPLDENGLEYLWGCSYFNSRQQRCFQDFWAHDALQEQQAFEAFISWVYQRWEANPGMHIYHYANYEIAACKRLMGRYGSCEQEVDDLLRNNVFVDLYKIVKGGMLVGEPRYSIKNIEKLYRGSRTTDVSTGGDSVVVYDNWRNAWLAGEESDNWQESEILRGIRDYNKDDCDSTQELVVWLREQQQHAGLQWSGTVGDGAQAPPEQALEQQHTRDTLLANNEHWTSVLAWSLEFHRRESKPTWWKYFERLEMSVIELTEDPECLGACLRTGKTPFKPTPKARNLAYEYQFDTSQEFRSRTSSLRISGFVDDAGKEISITLLPEHSDLTQGLICVQAKREPPAHCGFIPYDFINPHPIPAALFDVAQTIAASIASTGDADTEDSGSSHDGKHSAIIDFLKRNKPRFNSGTGGAIVTAASPASLLNDTIDAVKRLDASYLPIQGPPGTGKTYSGARIIGALLRDGARIGIASNSHPAINNLLIAVARFCRDEDISASLICTKNTDPALEASGVAISSNSRLAGHLCDALVIGTTAWGFAREDLANELDYLFVDEAGQVSVANLIAMSRSARNLVLLGDQMQLPQPLQGTHPGDSGLSVLEYLMQEHATVPEDMGIFLPETHRMHPALNAFVSRYFYDNKLQTADNTARRFIDFDEQTTQSIKTRAGLVYVPVSHQGNTQSSVEEVHAIKQIVATLEGRKLHGFEHGQGCADNETSRPLTLQDMLFVTPYNLQVNYLQQALGDQAKVGSVDKFQGQEAPVVIVSLCASDASESPRGLSFLLDANRLNVALSRGQCLAIVVASPQLAYSPARSLEQMKLLNLFCAITQAAEQWPR